MGKQFTGGGTARQERGITETAIADLLRLCPIENLFFCRKQVERALGGAEPDCRAGERLREEMKMQKQADFREDIFRSLVRRRDWVSQETNGFISRFLEMSNEELGRLLRREEQERWEQRMAEPNRGSRLRLLLGMRTDVFYCPEFLDGFYESGGKAFWEAFFQEEGGGLSGLFDRERWSGKSEEEKAQWYAGLRALLFVGGSWEELQGWMDAWKGVKKSLADSDKRRKKRAKAFPRGTAGSQSAPEPAAAQSAPGMSPNPLAVVRSRAIKRREALLQEILDDWEKPDPGRLEFCPEKRGEDFRDGETLSFAARKRREEFQMDLVAEGERAAGFLAKKWFSGLKAGLENRGPARGSGLLEAAEAQFGKARLAALVAELEGGVPSVKKKAVTAMMQDEEFCYLLGAAEWRMLTLLSEKYGEIRSRGRNAGGEEKE